MNFIGQPTPRSEDPRLLRGQGKYIADLQFPGLLHAAFLRSPHAHARVRSVDLSKARALSGVMAVFGAGLHPDIPRLPHVFTHPALTAVTEQPLGERVHYTGEVVAMVVAENRYRAEDAIDQIEVDYELLPAVAQLSHALEEDAPIVHRGMDTNVAARFTQETGDAHRVLNEAPVVVRRSFEIGRAACLPIETRGLIAHWDDSGRETELVIHAATQCQHELRKLISTTLGFPERQIRVNAPDVGGAFGAKAPFYPEDLLVVWASRELGVPVRWIEDRIEHMTASCHERDQRHDAVLGVDRDGTILAVTDEMEANTGAYILWGVIVPLITSTFIPGPYRVPNYRCEVRVVYTHTTPHAPMRGAGRPQATMILNGLLDRAAEKLGLDPLEIRRRNLIEPDEFPYRTGLQARAGKDQVYDSGDYPRLVRELKDRGNYDAWKDRQREAKEQGRWFGIGTAVTVENTGFGNFEGATVRIEMDGSVTIHTGAATQGQGHETTLAQVAAEVLECPLDQITVREGDTDLIPYGTGTFASRIATIAGSAVHEAALKVRDKSLSIASDLLEVSEDDLEWTEGEIRVRGSDRSVSLGELAHEARGVLPGSTYTLSEPPGLEETEYFSPEAAAISSMADMAVVEVDPGTGRVQVLEYAAIHDCGTVLNPLIFEGQMQGGIAMGIGTALYEEMVYSDDGQPLSGTLMDYLVPTSCEIPDLNLGYIETPSPYNPLGVKGAGESGAIPVPAVMVAAVEDAVRDLGVRINQIPIRPGDVRRQVREGSDTSA